MGKAKSNFISSLNHCDNLITKLVLKTKGVHENIRLRHPFKKIKLDERDIEKALYRAGFS